MNTQFKTFIKYPKCDIYILFFSWTYIYDRNTKSDVIKRKRLNKNKTKKIYIKKVKSSQNSY